MAAPSQQSQPSLVRTLAACFEADPLINEYDFVPLLPPSTDNDDAFLVESHKLAISAAALKPLFQEAHTAFKAAAATGHHLLDITRALLLVNPDVYTAWNARKRLVAAGTISEASELAFVDLVFSKHTKKACAWAHRRWCLARLWGTAEQDEDSSSTVDAQEAHELGLTASIAERFPKNYYAWTHRWWVVKAGAKRRRIGSRAGPWLETQAAVGVEWVERHAWDFSAASFLLQALAAWAEEHDDSEAVEKRLRGMLEAGARQQDQCPGHESLWYKRRGLLALWMDQQQQRQQQWRRPAAAMMLLPPVLREEGGVARYPTSSSSTWKGVGACLGWELEMAVYYQAGQGPFYTEASGGLLWEAAARRRQRRCAWAHARWVLELVQRSCQTGQGSAAGMEGWARRLAEGLEVVRREAGLVPPGYGKLVRQLVAADFGEGRCE